VAEDLFGLGAPEGLGDVTRGDHGTERRVSGGEALRDGDEVGVESEAVATEPFAEAAEAGDHFVGDEQHPIGTTDFLDALEVASRRRQHPAGTDDGLADEGRDVIQAESFDCVCERVGVVPGHLLDVRNEPAEGGGIRGNSAE
jgi:hypothetical protein